MPEPLSAILREFQHRLACSQHIAYANFIFINFADETGNT